MLVPILIVPLLWFLRRLSWAQNGAYGTRIECTTG
jgi:hypothetical protein